MLMGKEFFHGRGGAYRPENLETYRPTNTTVGRERPDATTVGPLKMGWAKILHKRLIRWRGEEKRAG